MKEYGKNKDYRSVYKRYLFLSFSAVVLMTALCACFFSVCSLVLNRKIVNELYRDSERAAYDIEEHISANINALSAVSYFVEDENLSYVLSRLKEAKNDIDCYMLGILSREGVFYTTENQELDVRGSECFNKVLEGNIVKCEKFVFNDADCFLYGAPVYKGSVVTGGVCLTDTVGGLTDVFFSSEYTNFAVVSREGTILAENREFIKEKGNIGNIFSRENIEKYRGAADDGKPVFFRDYIDEEGARIQVYPLKVNDYVLVSILTDSGYRAVLFGYFYFVALTFIVFMIIMIAVIVFSVLFFKKSNISVLGQLERFAEASRALKITYIHHGYKRPGNISYSSRALNNAFGYSVAEIESLFKKRFEYLIYNEDRTRVFREFEDFFNSSETRRKISFRIITKDKKTMWYSDDMTKDIKAEKIISLLYPIDDLAEVQSRAAFLSKRLDLVSRASSYYVFELNLHDRELFITDNLKERLGYVITAQDCFKPSVRERLISPHSHKELEAMIRSYKRGDRSISGNLTVMTADGSFARFHIEAEVMGSIIKDEIRILAVLNEVYVMK